MKLIDILVEETIENSWSWPEHANCITQDHDREIMPATCQSSVARFDASFNRWFLDGSRVDCFTADVLASDYETAIITREQYEAALAAKNDEADLNECIGQDAALVWNGEGVIPPVGCVCERSWAGDEWQSCKILFASGQIVVVKLKESGREDAYNIGDVTFRPIRPIRSESDRKRDEAVKTIMLTGWCQAAAEEIYDLVAAGKVPGMKLED